MTLRTYFCPNKGMIYTRLKLLAIAVVAVIFSQACAQNAVKKSFPEDLKFRVAFWNLENLMDTIDDPGNDGDFTPSGSMVWNTHKFNNKMANLEKVIHLIHPDILGVCEVEHASLLQQLIARDSLQMVPYGVVHFESPDERGIDVGLIYNRNKMFVLKSEAIKVVLPDSDATRDILYVRFLIKTQRDTLNVFVNHWPSRREGREKSEAKRMAAADTLYGFIQKRGLDMQKTILMGDFNDDPKDMSISGALHAKAPETGAAVPGTFFNLNRTIATDTIGTLKFAGKWNMFDQITISPKLWPNSETIALKYHPGSFGVFAPDWMKQHDPKYEGYPLRTFGGKNWLNGYSDHFPVFAELRYE
jgi:predicted extracellular nuclease